jgi:DNA ligase 1
MSAMLLAEIAQASTDVAATSPRLGKVARLADCLALASADEVAVAVAYLSGTLPQGTVGVGWAALRELPPAAGSPSLELLEVDATVSRLQAISGQGSQAARRNELEALLSRATEPEQRLLVGLFLGELRQGALEGVMADAVAKAAGVPAPAVRRAAMLAGDLPSVAAVAMRDGVDGLGGFRLTPLQPITPMLAQTADDVSSALDRIGHASVEWKLDGARIQVHRANGEVRIFTRSLADITDRAPEIVDAVQGLDTSALVLDGEAIALREDGRPEPFQVTMSRFGTKTDSAELARMTPLSALFFDCLHIDGDDLIDAPTSRRLAALDAHLPPDLVVPRLETDDVEAAQAFLDDALARGHEGVMVKSLDAPYEAGRRGAGWLKVKPVHTLDLVVLAAEWGHGRRRGKLSNLHLGARDPATGDFVMLGKTFKGLTDEMLAWQTEHFLGLETRTDGHVVHVRPELVVEIAFDGVQSSPRYPGGVALRFARVKGYRPDRSPGDTDTIDTVRAIHARAE